MHDRWTAPALNGTYILYGSAVTVSSPGQAIMQTLDERKAYTAQEVAEEVFVEGKVRLTQQHLLGAMLNWDDPQELADHLFDEGVKGLVAREQDWRVNVDSDSLAAYVQSRAARKERGEEAEEVGLVQKLVLEEFESGKLRFSG